MVSECVHRAGGDRRVTGVLQLCWGPTLAASGEAGAQWMLRSSTWYSPSSQHRMAALEHLGASRLHGHGLGHILLHRAPGTQAGLLGSYRVTCRQRRGVGRHLLMGTVHLFAVLPNTSSQFPPPSTNCPGAASGDANILYSLHSFTGVVINGVGVKRKKTTS